MEVTLISELADDISIPDVADILIRVSTDGQDEDNQLAETLEHVRVRGYRKGEIFRIHGVSASSGEHEPWLEKILARFTERQAQVVVFAHSSRLDRRGGDGDEIDVTAQIKFMLDVRAAGGRVESVREPLFGKTDLPGMITTFLAQYSNAEYSRTLKHHTEAGKRAAREAGALIGRPPWGYTTAGEKRHKKLVPTDDGRVYVPQIYQRIIGGDSTATVAKWLNDEGVPPYGIANEDNPRGKHGTWWAHAIWALIRNPTYKGLRCEQDPKTKEYGKTLHVCEGLVDAAIWQRANNALSLHPRRGPIVRENRAMLAGVLSCGNPECTAGPDSPMYRIRSGNVKKQRPIWYYRCSGRGTSRKGCGNLVLVSTVDNAVNEIIAESFGTPVMKRKIVPGNTHDIEVRLAEIRYAIKQLGARYANDDITDDEYETMMDALRAERKQAEAVPRIPDHEEVTPTGDTYADLYAALGTSQRASWLGRQGFKVHASRARVEVSQGTVKASQSLG